MENSNVQCPKCGNTFDVSEILAHRIKENLTKDYQQQYAEVKRLKEEVLKQQTQIEDQILKSVNLKLKAEKVVLEKKIRIQMESENSEQIKSYESQLKSQTDKTKELLKFKAEYQKVQRENDILKEQYEAEFQSRLTKALSEAKAKIKSDIEKTTGFKIAEKDILIDQLKTEIKNAQKRIDQSSQQLQGEAAEITVEKWLKDSFPSDEVSEYKKGERGADVLLFVKTSHGDVAGKLIFEVKRTKTWQKDWLEKMKDDMRKKAATFGILITDVYPKGMSRMSQVNDIWICSFTEYQNLTVVLRQAALLLYELQCSQKNKGSKMEMLHQFLTGPEFRNSVESILQSFTSLKTDLDKEKAVLQGYWKAREIQLDKVLLNTAEMYHSIKAIIGAKVPSIKRLEGPDDKKALN